jgi:hypothetical protein
MKPAGRRRDRSRRTHTSRRRIPVLRLHRPRSRDRNRGPLPHRRQLTQRPSIVAAPDPSDPFTRRTTPTDFQPPKETS